MNDAQRARYMQGTRDRLIYEIRLRREREERLARREAAKAAKDFNAG